MRLDQIPASVNVLKLCITTQYISSLNGIILKKYIETKLRPNVKFKRFQFLIYQKLFRNRRQNDNKFVSFKVKLKSGPQIGTSFPAKLLKEHVETASIFLSIEISSKKYTKMSSIFRSSIFMLKKVRQNNINFFHLSKLYRTKYVKTWNYNMNRNNMQENPLLYARLSLQAVYS